MARAGGRSWAAQSAVSTLRTVIKAMGGELEIRAVFPQGTMRINQFSAIDEGAGTKRRETA